MMGSLDPLGLRVEQITPITFANNIDINSDLKILFNSELNVDTISGSVYLLEDKEKKYIRNNRINIDDFEIVMTSLSYRDKTIILRPFEQLKEDCRYIIYIDSKILQDILGNLMILDYMSYFDTTNNSYNPCSVIIPENNSIISSLEHIQITDTDCDRYCLQISMQPDFENIVFDEIIDGININKEYPLEDGLYYIRAKEENAPEYGVANIFSIKSYRSTTVSDQDLDEDFVFEKITEEELQVLASYPDNDMALVNVKSATAYMKFNKIISDEEIDFYESTFEGELVDDTDKYMSNNLTSEQLAHGEVNGHFVVVCDKDKEETYIFFVPDSL